MFQGLTGWHFVIILFIILLLFGAPKLPGLAKSIGQSMKILKKEVRNPEDEGGAQAGDSKGETAAAGAAADAASPIPAAEAQPAAEPATDLEAELARAKAEAERAKAEAEALRAAAEKRTEQQ